MLKRFIQPSYTTVRHYSQRKTNPFISRQGQYLEATQEISEDPEGFGDIETDFMNVHKSHKQHERELVQQREQMRLWKTKNKHFNVKYPNFLTYAEKEQIKLLHNQDATEWTAEKLADSFPADPETIMKIIKAKWVPSSEKRVRVHDQGVMRNWSLLKEGKCPELSRDLREHISRFTERSEANFSNYTIEKEFRPALPKPKGTEFAGIITSCKKNQQPEESPKLIGDKENEHKASSTHTNPFSAKPEMANDKSEPQNPFINRPRNDQNDRPKDEDTYIMDRIIDKRRMRLSDMKEIKFGIRPLAAGAETSLQTAENPSGTGVVDPIQSPLSVQKFKTNEVVITEQDMKKYDVTTIKERIHIPRKLFKEGATYKVEDCYYDDDGEFLYRIPGMTGKNVH